MTDKACALCQVVQPETNYTPIGEDRRHSYCKRCRRDQAREERLLYPEKNRERKRRYNRKQAEARWNRHDSAR